MLNRALFDLWLTMEASNRDCELRFWFDLSFEFRSTYMAKQGRKLRNTQSSHSDDEVSEPKDRLGSSAPVEAEVVTPHR